ncbi:unnamed protein product [Sphagnum troendelagicum]|uniref:Uncharacterized protein n=1 Tax=Sphagnum troendelagicum TaxID=128251 RepID=A0ABP0UA48_9BRYO
MPNLLQLQEAQLSAGQSSSCWTEAIYKLLVPVQRIFLFFSSSCKSCRALNAALREASCHCSLSQDQKPTRLYARSVHVQGNNKKERRAAIAAANVVVEGGGEEKNPLRQFRCNRCLKEIAQACC